MMNNKHPETAAFDPLSSVSDSTDEGFRRISAAVVADVFQHGTGDDGRSLNPDSIESVRVQPAGGFGRSAADDWRTALHESGHVVVGRALGSEVGGVTIIPCETYGGLTWGPAGNSARLSSLDEKPDLCEMIAGLMPGFGEPRVNAAEVFTHVHVRVAELMAGTAAETLLHPFCPPWTAHSDIREARSIASIVCTSEAAIDAYLLFGLAEAKALITKHRAAVLAIAETLMIELTLDTKRIDNIIAAAPERARRADWVKVLESAAAFGAKLEN